jgi:hypothetical protein
MNNRMRVRMPEFFENNASEKLTHEEEVALHQEPTSDALVINRYFVGLADSHRHEIRNRRRRPIRINYPLTVSLRG